MRGPDQLEDIGEVAQPMRRAHARSDLQLDEHRKRDQGDPGPADTDGFRIRETHWLRAAVAWILTGHDDVDGNAMLRVPYTAASGELFDVPASKCQCPERLESFGCQQHVDVDGHSPVPILVERHRPEH